MDHFVYSAALPGYDFSERLLKLFIVCPAVFVIITPFDNSGLACNCCHVDAAAAVLIGCQQYICTVVIGPVTRVGEGKEIPP